MREKQLRFFDSEDNANNIKRRYTVVLPIDTLILVSVVIVLLLTIAFSTGVERGRRVVLANGAGMEMAQAGPVSVDPALQYNDREPFGEQIPSEIQILVDELRQQDMPRKPQEITAGLKEVNAERAISKAEKKYFIQVASYRRKETALKEAEKLEDKGYQVEVLKKGDYVAIFVGEFGDKEKARESLKSLRKKYKDCFIRRL